MISFNEYYESSNNPGAVGKNILPINLTRSNAHNQSVSNILTDNLDAKIVKVHSVSVNNQLGGLANRDKSIHN